jgi:hypothetical protein
VAQNTRHSVMGGHGWSACRAIEPALSSFVLSMAANKLARVPG